MDNYNRPTHKAEPRLIIGTGLLLMLVFLAIIMLFFVFSLITPSFIGPCVAVVDISVPLSVEGVPPSLFDAGYPSSEDFADTIDGLNDRPDVGAVLFIMNSPGGSVVASGEVYDAVKSLDKPKVSYFREVAASGAYYVAMGTDYIISDPNALTGSIGVISTTVQMADLMEKIGVNVTEIKSGEHKDIGSSFRNMTEEEHELLQAIIDEVYQEFRSIVLEGRKGKLNMAMFDEVTDGRILSGRQAYKAGLVDQLGNKDDALLKAAELAGMEAETADDVRICYVPTEYQEGGLFSMQALFDAFSMKAGSPSLSYR